MKRLIYLVFTISFLMLWSSCRKDFDFTPSTGSLEFSKDTVYLDTVFNKTSSSTYNLKVYNRSNEDILIPSIKLSTGEASNYRLNVDGLAGKTFQNIPVLAKDSIFIFIETTVNNSNFSNLDGTFLNTDQIEFDTNTNLQKVELVSLIQDAVFIYPDRDNTTKVIDNLQLTIGGELYETDINGRELLPNELTFTNDKPYVIYGFAAVPNNETLTIEAGARIHFHENSGLIVGEGATLNVNGSLSADPELLENEVIFEGDRLEPDYSDVPGQWGTIWFFDGSINNTINYATIKNAIAGILCDGNPNEINNKLTITNSQIYNSSSYGILGRNTSIKGDNVVINNSGQVSFAGTIGGKYNFTHSTLVNYWDNGFRQFPSVLLNNFILDEENNATLADLTEANFNNCIIYGNDNPEILVDELEDDNVVFNFKFTNCLIRFKDENNNFTGPNYDLNDASKFEGNIFNEDPNFLDTSLNKLMIGDESAAINKGNASFATQVPVDILNVNRTASPDLGAYQHITFPEED
ncbi:hypothetical protein [Thalassobellus sediminis]|uniref:hypothetical protein n=1 Tax=Thalassobellus sediminis TaxID=3367753 RepID=UPI003798506A